jgi:hypothetical protein
MKQAELARTSQKQANLKQPDDIDVIQAGQNEELA